MLILYPYPYVEEAFKSSTCSGPFSSEPICRFSKADRCASSMATIGAPGAATGDSGCGNAAGIATAQAITANKRTSTCHCTTMHHHDNHHARIKCTANRLDPRWKAWTTKYFYVQVKREKKIGGKMYERYGIKEKRKTMGIKQKMYIYIIDSDQYHVKIYIVIHCIEDVHRNLKYLLCMRVQTK